MKEQDEKIIENIRAKLKNGTANARPYLGAPSATWDGHTYNVKLDKVEIAFLLAFLGGDIVTNEQYCTCGNPSKQGNIRFEGDEKLVYECIDCGKTVK